MLKKLFLTSMPPDNAANKVEHMQMAIYEKKGFVIFILNASAMFLFKAVLKSQARITTKSIISSVLMLIALRVVAPAMTSGENNIATMRMINPISGFISVGMKIMQKTRMPKICGEKLLFITKRLMARPKNRVTKNGAGFFLSI